MSVNPRLQRKILVVHGVQPGTDADLNQHLEIKELVIDRLNGVHVDFDTEMYRYENINDDAQRSFRNVLEIFTANLAATQVIENAADVIGDVVLSLRNGTTAQAIRDGLTQKILESYEAGNPLYLLAHSLGSVYAFDVVNQLMKKNRYFNRNSRKTWPVQALITIGSPLGLRMFRRNKVTNMGPGRHYFRWLNIWDPTDPVVTGSIYGKPYQGYKIAEKFSHAETGWIIQDESVDIGRVWLRSHTGYWNNAILGEALIPMITS